MIRPGTPLTHRPETPGELLPIEATNVAKRFGSHTALQGASLNLSGGQVYGLIGRNGAGKTTLLRALAGQIRVQGEITYGGQPVFDNTAVLDNLILAGPDVPWPSDIKIKGLLNVARLRWRNWDDALAATLLEDFELDTSKTLATLSRGQKSLVSIVIGLSAQCPFTFLDEPYLGLDVQNRDLFYRHLLADIERFPRTVILSTHHVEDAERILDSVILLDQGLVTSVGSIDSVMERVAVLSGSTSAIDSALLRLPAGCTLSDATASGIRRVVIDVERASGGVEQPPMSAERLAERLDGTGVRIQRTSLEQAILALTGRSVPHVAEEAGR